MRPGTHNITVQRGEDYTLSFSVVIDDVTLDLTGATAYAQVRETEARDSTLIADFSTSIDANHLVSCLLSDTVSDPITQGQGYYDVLIVDAGGTDTFWLRGRVIFEGSLTVKP